MSGEVQDGPKSPSVIPAFLLAREGRLVVEEVALYFLTVLLRLQRRRRRDGIQPQ